jgi:tricorn protease
LRYLAWERERMQRVETAGQGKLGYVHLQSMRDTDIARWAREFYPVFNRDGLILDVRYNGGGNIDSWIIEKLQRRAWSFWKSRQGEGVYWNQQQAFRGHIVALVNERTYSDGETISEALKRLGIATVIGTRTAGAGIWLSDRNRLNDGGIMRAAESGVFVSTPTENKWIIEGEGVKPDIVVDNLPFETFNGRDAQLEAAIAFLQDKLKKEPIHVPVIPPRPSRVPK